MLDNITQGDLLSAESVGQMGERFALRHHTWCGAAFCSWAAWGAAPGDPRVRKSPSSPKPPQHSSSPPERGHFDMGKGVLFCCAEKESKDSSPCTGCAHWAPFPHLSLHLSISSACRFGLRTHWDMKSLMVMLAGAIYSRIFFCRVKECFHGPQGDTYAKPWSKCLANSQGIRIPKLRGT